MERAEEIFLAVVELEGEARTDYLDSACDGDPSLRAEVVALLEWSERADEFLEQPPTLGILPPTGLAPGCEVGHLVIEEEIGRGGMGCVFRARDRRLDRVVAVKTLAPSLFADPARVALLEREARLTAALNHPNIATIHSVEDRGDERFLVLEYLDGPTLAETLGPGVEVETALEWARQLASALEAAHSEGVIHRDLKPTNLKITRDGRLKVLDFGIALGRGDGGRAAPAGTPGYMSPEQRRGEELDPRTDIYSWGCLVAQLVLGRVPREAEPIETELAERVPTPVARLVAAALEVDRAKRISSATTLRQGLEEELARRSSPLDVGTASAERGLGNVRRPLIELVGREAALAEFDDHWNSTRWVTITGPGGVGKTAFAAAVAWHTRATTNREVWWVELAGLDRPEHVVAAVLETLGLRVTSDRAPLDTLVDALAGRQLLLVLDNGEHVLDAVWSLAEALLARTGDVRLLVTSRERLDVAAERVFELEPLELPRGSDWRDTVRAPSVAYFQHCVGPDFELDRDSAPIVASICRRLEGLPLGIELAAARARMIDLPELDRRLDEGTRILASTARDRSQRQRTLDATLDWSHDLLDEAERTLFRRLGVFRTRFALDSVEAVCAGDDIAAWEVLDLLARLVSKSLVTREVRRDEREPARFRLLEPVRQYAARHLESHAEATAIRVAHRTHFGDLARRLARHYIGPRRGETLARFAAQYDDFRVALDACLDPDHGDLSAGFELAATLGGYWLPCGRWAEGRAFCETLLERATGREEPRARAHLLKTVGNLAYWQGDFAPAFDYQTAGVAIFRTLGSDRDVAGLTSNLGLIAWKQGDYPRAESLYRESLEIRRALDDRAGVASSLNNLGTLAKNQEHFDEAEAALREAIAIRRELGDLRGVSQSTGNLGGLLAVTGRLDEAKRCFEEAIAIDRSQGERAGVSAILNNLGSHARLLGDPAAALGHYRESLEIRAELGDQPGIAESLYGIAGACSMLGERGEPRASEDAARLIAASTNLAARVGLVRPPAVEREIDQLRERLQSSLGEQAETLFSEGARFALEDAIALALGRSG